MEYKLMDEVSSLLKQNKKVAMAIVTKVEGSTPRNEGSMMIVSEKGEILGTVGGGNLELTTINEAKKCLKEGKSKLFKFKLNDQGSLHMQCGGDAEIFIKIFNPNHKLLIAGGGHVGLELHKLGKMLGFYTVILDDREEFCNKDRFPDADELNVGVIEENIKEYSIDSNTYIVIVTRGHQNDENVLREVLNKGAKYIGMIGSSKKNKYIMNNLLNEGLDKERLNKIYAPIGINLGGENPSEVAFSIMSEILMVKNEGSLKHMKEIKGCL
ncbi:XdhC family protein [Lutibacter sp. B2]|nr:XdhC family protein [Lutibacter sp. B2]